MIRQSSAVSRPNRLAKRKASPFSKQSLAHAFRVIAPILVALTFASAAHAQGTMDFSGAQTLMGTFKTTTLQTIREGAEAGGYVVEGFAPTSKAAGQLREAESTPRPSKAFLAVVTTTRAPIQ